MSELRIPNRAGLSVHSLNDDEYEDSTITEVTESKDGEWYTLSMDSSGIGMRKAYDGHPPHGIVPKVGGTFRFYGQIGFAPRGIAIDGVIVYWHTPDEEKEANDAADERRDDLCEELRQDAINEATYREGDAAQAAESGDIEEHPSEQIGRLE